MNNKERIILIKVISEIEVIEKMVLGYTDASFFADEKTQRAVSMTLINIGELVKSLSAEFRSLNSGLPWRAITGLRDIVAHKYQTLKMGDIWLTCSSDIPQLKEKISDILSGK
jgi:uncharacterized protein with HEPN domain